MRSIGPDCLSSNFSFVCGIHFSWTKPKKKTEKRKRETRTRSESHQSEGERERERARARDVDMQMLSGKQVDSALRLSTLPSSIEEYQTMLSTLPTSTTLHAGAARANDKRRLPYLTREKFLAECISLRRGLESCALVLKGVSVLNHGLCRETTEYLSKLRIKPWNRLTLSAKALGYVPSEACSPLETHRNFQIMFGARVKDYIAVRNIMSKATMTSRERNKVINWAVVNAKKTDLFPAESRLLTMYQDMVKNENQQIALNESVQTLLAQLGLKELPVADDGLCCWHAVLASMTQQALTLPYKDAKDFVAGTIDMLSGQLARQVYEELDKSEKAKLVQVSEFLHFPTAGNDDHQFDTLLRNGIKWLLETGKTPVYAVDALLPVVSKSAMCTLVILGVGTEEQVSVIREDGAWTIPLGQNTPEVYWNTVLFCLQRSVLEGESPFQARLSGQDKSGAFQCVRKTGRRPRDPAGPVEPTRRSTKGHFMA